MKKILDFSGGSLIVESDSGNDAYCPTRHPLFKGEKIGLRDLLNLHEPSEFHFTSDAVGYLNDRYIFVRRNQWNDQRPDVIKEGDK